MPDDGDDGDDDERRARRRSDHDRPSVGSSAVAGELAARDPERAARSRPAPRPGRGRSPRRRRAGRSRSRVRGSPAARGPRAPRRRRQLALERPRAAGRERRQRERGGRGRGPGAPASVGASRAAAARRALLAPSRRRWPASPGRAAGRPARGRPPAGRPGRAARGPAARRRARGARPPTRRPIAPSSRRPARGARRPARPGPGTTSSAAADGVGARTSAAKSASVTSTSWPTPADDRHGVGDDGPDDALVVERPEVLQRAAAAGEDRHAAGASSGARPRARCAIQRSTRRNAVTMLAGASSPWTWAATSTTRTSGQRRASTWQMSRQTAPGRARDDRDRRGSDAAAAACAPRRTGPPAVEPRLERLEAQRQVAEPGRLDRVDVELERALRLVQVDPAVGDDPEPGLGLERRADAVVAEPDALELVALVLEREVGVPGGRHRDPADLALDPQVARAAGPRGRRRGRRG